MLCSCERFWSMLSGPGSSLRSSQACRPLRQTMKDSREYSLHQAQANPWLTLFSGVFPAWQKSMPQTDLRDSMNTRCLSCLSTTRFTDVLPAVPEPHLLGTVPGPPLCIPSFSVRCSWPFLPWAAVPPKKPRTLSPGLSPMARLLPRKSSRSSLWVTLFPRTRNLPRGRKWAPPSANRSSIRGTSRQEDWPWTDRGSRSPGASLKKAWSFCTAWCPACYKPKLQLEKLALRGFLWVNQTAHGPDLFCLDGLRCRIPRGQEI